LLSRKQVDVCLVPAAGIAEECKDLGWLAAQVDCCSLRRGADTIRFDRDCSPEDVLATNHTAAALAAGS